MESVFRIDICNKTFSKLVKKTKITKTKNLKHKIPHPHIETT